MIRATAWKMVPLWVAVALGALSRPSQSTNRLNSAPAPRLSWASTPRIARSQTCMKVTPSSLTSEPARKRNTIMSPKSRTSQRIITSNRLVGPRTTLMNLSKGTLLMKIQKLRKANWVSQIKMTLKRRKHFYKKIRCPRRTKRSIWKKSPSATLTALMTSMETRWTLSTLY